MLKECYKRTTIMLVEYDPRNPGAYSSKRFHILHDYSLSNKAYVCLFPSLHSLLTPCKL